MQRKTADARTRFIDRIVELARERAPTGHGADIAEFVRQYYRNIGLEDLKAHSPENLAGSVMGHLAMAAVREPGTPLIRVFNPDPEGDGWTSEHTIVQMVNDDMPFLVDSVSMAINRKGLYIHLTVHPVMRLKRDLQGALTRIVPLGRQDADSRMESLMQIEVDRETDPGALQALETEFASVLGDVRAACEDWAAMRERAAELVEELDRHPPPLEDDVVRESRELLSWMEDDHFTFLGYREYELVSGKQSDELRSIPGTGLGILRRPPPKNGAGTTRLTGREIRKQARSKDLLIITKANSRATVHRDGYLDYVGIKHYDASGEVVGERRFLGLWTSAAYSRPPREIPLLRDKVRRVMEASGFRKGSHGGKALIHILDTYPRDELFQSSVDDLIRICGGIYTLQERQRTKIFLRRDAFRRYFSCLVYVPRDRYNTQVRERIQDILLEAFKGVSIDSSVEISQSKLARVHLIVHTPQGASGRVNLAALEKRIAEAVRTWQDDLKAELIERFGEETGLRLFKRYSTCFPAAFVEDVTPREATFDIERLEALREEPSRLRMSLYRPPLFDEDRVRFKLFHAEDPLPLSEILPMLENMGLRVIGERPYRVRLGPRVDSPVAWIQDFEMASSDGSVIHPGKVNEAFQCAFEAVWLGRAESDGFNRLVLKAGLDWRQVCLIRACCRYLLQTGIPFSQTYMEQVLVQHALIARMIVEQFEARFDPSVPDKRRDRMVITLTQALDHAMDAVASLDADRILGAFRALIRAMLRTNFFRSGEDGGLLPYMSFKLDPSKVPDLPLPRPKFEIFVYSPRVEGVHLRGGFVARGGLRWSDRREDFRTEVLGLMKAQAVKNVLIVPVGAKGGFVPKKLPAGDRDAVLAEGIECYRTFIRGLLDVTDNLVDGVIEPPPDVVRHDQDDAYLVVAADKGTATFSDIANGLSVEYGFWLGDAFASGGSIGYDHKKMGITARGAWEAVKRHFRELGRDIQSEGFTAAGIGDMGGDVFGNGMLLSRHTRLVAAFNHMHIFLDPDPDPEKSFEERRRLFEMPRSTWADYDPALISTGGGVFERTEKLVRLSPQVRDMLDVDAESMTPDELIRAILRMPVDLLWNGGIGTYVKASSETNADAGDRSNDSVRVNGRDLRCRVVGEGGNLGFTQRGRVEYAQSGGRLNTDFIDNSAGVDTSDHEVNIKILLGASLRHRPLTPARRKKLLSSMTDEVADLVLRNNYLQTQALSVAESTSPERIREHLWFIRLLERRGELDRGLEFLPGDDEFEARMKAGTGLTRPELSVLTSYSKMALYSEMIRSNVPEDPYLGDELERYFPHPLRKRYAEYMGEHPLAREIIATMITNSLVNRMGSVFAFRMQSETGADIAGVARAFTIAREVFDVRTIWAGIEALDNQIKASSQYSMLRTTQALLKQATRWLIDRADEMPDIAQAVSRIRPGVAELAGSLGEVLGGSRLQRFLETTELYVAGGVPQDLARRISSLGPMHSALDVISVAEATGVGVRHAADVYFGIARELDLDWILDQVDRLHVEGHWQAKARGSLRDNLFGLQRILSVRIVSDTHRRSTDKAISEWLAAREERVAHVRQTLAEMRGAGPLDFATASVALQEIRRLAEG
jgi:glutamate dehydrogenase